MTRGEQFGWGGRLPPELAASILDAAPATLLLDQHGAILWVNPAYTKLTGYTLEEAMGRTPEALQSGSACYRDAWDAISAGRSWRGELKSCRKDGQPHWEEHVFSAVNGSGGEIYFVATQRDIASQKSLEAERDRLQAQLVQAQKMEAIGRLAGSIAHDFNNLLTVINGYCDLTLRQLEGDDRTRVAMEEIRKAGGQAAGLVRQLLTFSRRQLVRKETINLNGLIRSMELMLGRLLGEEVEVVVQLDARLEAVLADPHQMEQVLMNLAVNSRDAMPGGGTLTIETRNIDDAQRGRCVRLTVRDTGEGMNEDIRQHLFEPFFTTKDPGTGTGFGLATVHGIVTQSQGRIHVESESGKGTAFHIDLPAVGRASEAGQA